ncbi:MAG: site-2 protease family protein [Candidatus Bathyarchaeota archaeon]|nr:site-2 protease family protein [Candidatus Bathyarchaeota archaeon]
MEPQTPPPQQETEEKRVDFKFPLLILRTKRFARVFETLGRMRGVKYVSWLFLIFVPFVAGIALYLLLNSLVATITNPLVGQVARELGPGAVLLLPGLNPMLPIVYGWLAIVVAIVIHEGAHGVIARNVDLRVKSSGLLFFLIIPIGAFVDVDEEQIKTARARRSLKVMAGGVGGNVLVGVVCLIGLLLVVGSLAPIVDGVYISQATDGMPAQAAGLKAEDILVSIDNVTITDSAGLREYLDAKTAGDLVEVIVARGDQWQIRYTTTLNLTVSDNRTVLGVMAGDLMTHERLQTYRSFSLDKLALYIVPPTLASAVVPYSDSMAPFYTSPIPGWQILANALFWIWFVNFNVAIFNALPLYPLDGGRIFDITLKRFAGKRLSEKTIRLITVGVSFTCVAIVALGIILPFLL